jgi:hypothetical protein
MEQRRRACLGVLADSSARRAASAPHLCVGIPFTLNKSELDKEEEELELEERHRLWKEVAQNDKSNHESARIEREDRPNDAWKFACVGLASVDLAKNGDQTKKRLPKCRGLEILVQELVAVDAEEDFVVDLTSVDQRRSRSSVEIDARRTQEIPNEFNEKFFAHARLVLKNMQKHAKYVAKGGFMKDL